MLGGDAPSPREIHRAYSEEPALSLILAAEARALSTKTTCWVVPTEAELCRAQDPAASAAGCRGHCNGRDFVPLHPVQLCGTAQMYHMAKS